MGNSRNFDAIGFAGGGNRCYWQGGFWEALNQRHPQKPGYVVAVSAGSYKSCFNIIGIGSEVRARAFARSAELKAALAGRPEWKVKPGEYFRAFLTEIFGPRELDLLSRAPEILIQHSHPPDWLPAKIAAPAAILLYQLEKLVKRGSHSKAGRHLGFGVSWASTHAIKTPAELVEAIMSSSSVPPLLPAGQFGGRICLDGGLVDNPPLQKLAMTEAEGGRTLILSTRHGKMPAATANRITVGPSQDLAVAKFTVRDADGLRAAYELGRSDGEAFARSL